MTHTNTTAHTVTTDGGQSAERIRARVNGAPAAVTAAPANALDHARAVAGARLALQKTTELHETALAEVHRIADAMKAEAPSVEAARTAMDLARTRFQDVSAAAALGEADQAAVKAAAGELTRCEKDLATADAAALGMAGLSEGLARRLEAAQAAEEDAHAAVKRAESTLFLAALIQADAAYVLAAEELAHQAGRVVGLANLLGKRARGLVPAASLSHIGMPNLPTIGPVSAGVVAARTNGRAHGVRDVLIEARHIGAGNTATLEAEILLGIGEPSEDLA